jgi:hypothetical protein
MSVANQLLLQSFRILYLADNGQNISSLNLKVGLRTHDHIFASMKCDNCQSILLRTKIHGTE